MNKQELRQQFLLRRLSLSRSDYWKLTSSLLRELEKIDWSRHTFVHIILPISRNNEVDTFSVIDFFRQHYPSIQILIPRTNFETFEMENILFDPEYTVLARNKFGIPEPIYGQRVDAARIDVVFVPLLAFDYFGHRVGYGKGFYDRFFQNCREDVLKVGLSYFDAVEEIADRNPYDVRMDLCIVPGKVWDFRG